MASLRVDKAGKLALSEADVVKLCIEYLQWSGWECIRQHVGMFTTQSGRKISVGTKGDPDWLILCSVRKRPNVHCIAFFLEFKRPGGKLSKAQRARHNDLHQFGFEVLVCDGLDQLKAWLEARGLT